MKLIQIKPFNSQTITNDIAAELCAIGGLWNHYTEDQYKSKGFEIKDEPTEWIIYNEKGERTGSCSQPSNQPAGWRQEEAPTGVSIRPLCGTRQHFRIWADGRMMCMNKWKKGDWKGSSPDKGDEYYSEDGSTLEYPANQIKYVEKLIELGFYLAAEDHVCKCSGDENWTVMVCSKCYNQPK